MSVNGVLQFPSEKVRDLVSLKKTMRGVFDDDAACDFVFERLKIMIEEGQQGEGTATDTLFCHLVLALTEIYYLQAGDK